MIKLQNMTPEVYYQESRDFQFIGRLYDIVLNYIKMQTDQIYNLPLSQNSDEKLLDLMMMTLGFQSKHNYNTKQLRALCGAFTEIMRNKGSMIAIELACKTLLNAEGISNAPVIDFEPLATDAAKKEKDYTKLIIYISDKLSDLNLLKDLLNYILPAGMSVNIFRRNFIEVTSDGNTPLAYVEKAELVQTNSQNIAVVVDPTEAVSGYGGDYARTKTEDGNRDNFEPSHNTGYTVNSTVIDTSISEATGEE